MSREMWSQVKKFSDGDKLNAETLNVPISQLGERTAYLYARLKALAESDKMSSVVLTDVTLSTAEDYEPDVGNVVYIDTTSQEEPVASRAKASMSLYDDFTAAESAFSIGILIHKEGNVGDVLVYGRLNLNPSGSPLLKSSMIESSETFRSGRYYLSANEAGKMTANPNGPQIYVCSICGNVTSNGSFDRGEAMVTPQFLDIGTSHVHRTAVLTARPAGTLSTSGYLPLNYLNSSGVLDENALSLRFGGTWTADSDIYYRFSLPTGQRDWPNAVELTCKRWIADEEDAAVKTVIIPGPDIEVPLPFDDGLTVQLSLPSSTKDTAYTIDTEEADKCEWPTLAFPDAGKGWLDHRPTFIAQLAESYGLAGAPNPKIAIRGRMPDSPMAVNVACPSETQILSIGTVERGATFTYQYTTYEFTDDIDSFDTSSSNIPVEMGPTKADSVHNLAEKLNKLSGVFAVFDGSDESVVLVAMDAGNIDMGGIVAYKDTRTCTGYDVSGPNAVDSMSMVVYDANHWILSADTAVVDGVQSYVWQDIGNDLAIMVFQEVNGTTPAKIEGGAVLSCVFNDDEPNAIYDYAIGFEQAIAKYWPPVPAKSAALMVNGVEMDNKALLSAHPTVSFGRDTLHWFASSDDRKPWPEAFVVRGRDIDPADDKTEVMHWVRGFQGSTGPVTSLQVRSGSPFKLVGFGTDQEANVGDLEIVGDFDFQMVNGGAPGYIVPKRAINGKLVGGPVVERIVAGPGIAVVSMAGMDTGQGTVVIALDDGEFHNQFTDIALENAEQSKIGMFPYIRLKGYNTSLTSPSAFTATMRVPTNLPDGEYFLHIIASVFGETGFRGASVQSACIKFSYNILPDFDVASGLMYRNLKSSLLAPNSDRTVIIPFGHVGESSDIVYNGFDPILMTTEGAIRNDSGSVEDNKADVLDDGFGPMIPTGSDFYMQVVDTTSIALRPGYLVGIRISRAVTPSNYTPYTGNIGFINLSWSLVASEAARSEGVSTVIDGKATSEALGADVIR